jgi:hypothetical protein
MEKTVGPMSTCGRKLLRGWWRTIDLMMSFMIVTASVQNILDTTTYGWSKPKVTFSAFFLNKCLSVLSAWLKKIAIL